MEMSDPYLRQKLEWDMEKRFGLDSSIEDLRNDKRAVWPSWEVKELKVTQTHRLEQKDCIVKKRQSFPRQYLSKGTKKLIHGAFTSQDLGAQTPWSLSDPKAKQQKTSVRNVGEEQKCLNGYLSGNWKQWTLSTSYPFLPFSSGWNLVGKVSGVTTSIKCGKGESLKQDRGIRSTYLRERHDAHW